MHILPLWPKWSNRARLSLLHVNQCNTCTKYIQQTFSDTGQLGRTVPLERTNRKVLPLPGLAAGRARAFP